MLKKPKLPPAKFREWASSLLRIETLADAALCVLAGTHEQNRMLRTLVRETRSLRQRFVRQIENDYRTKGEAK
jgi:hypothetical protein